MWMFRYLTPAIFAGWIDANYRERYLRLLRLQNIIQDSLFAAIKEARIVFRISKGTKTNGHFLLCGQLYTVKAMLLQPYTIFSARPEHKNFAAWTRHAQQ